MQNQESAGSLLEPDFTNIEQAAFLNNYLIIHIFNKPFDLDFQAVSIRLKRFPQKRSVCIGVPCVDNCRVVNGADMDFRA